MRLDDGTVLVQTVDLFGPIVDDPEDYGRIAAANAISDIYAMGGTPRYALAILAVPADLDPAVTGAILRGGALLAQADGVAIIGGHTFIGPEPLYGLAVTGIVSEDAIWTNAGGQPGDLLCLTKPLGTGIIAHALRQDAASPEALAAAVVVMTTTNRAAAEALRSVQPHAVVDVSGFGLVGHLHQLARESGCAAQIDLSTLPLIDGVRELAEADVIPGGSRRNRQAAAVYLSVRDGADDVRISIACDAQTSGGLLAAVSRETDLARLPGPVIGCLVAGRPGQVELC